VPTNLLIVGGMLMPNPTLKAVIFWQWANQSLNGGLVCASKNKQMLIDEARSLRQLLECQQEHRDV
jgi:hypothetical protein